MKNRTRRINPLRNAVKMFYLQNKFTLESIVLLIQGLKKLRYPSLMLTFYLVSNFEPEIEIFSEQTETEIKN